METEDRIPESTAAPAPPAADGPAARRIGLPRALGEILAVYVPSFGLGVFTALVLLHNPSLGDNDEISGWLPALEEILQYVMQASVTVFGVAFFCLQRGVSLPMLFGKLKRPERPEPVFPHWPGFAFAGHHWHPGRGGSREHPQPQWTQQWAQPPGWGRQPQPPQPGWGQQQPGWGQPQQPGWGQQPQPPQWGRPGQPEPGPETLPPPEWALPDPSAPTQHPQWGQSPHSPASAEQPEPTQQLGPEQGTEATRQMGAEPTSPMFAEPMSLLPGEPASPGLAEPTSPVGAEPTSPVPAWGAQPTRPGPGGPGGFPPGGYPGGYPGGARAPVFFPGVPNPPQNRSRGWQFVRAYFISMAGVLGFLISVVVYTNVTSRQTAAPDQGSSPWLVLVGLVVALAAGFGEEMLVTGLATNALEQAGMTGKRAWVIYLVAICLRIPFHLYYGWASLAVIIFTVVNIYVYRRWRLLWPIILAHATYDFFEYVGSVVPQALGGLLILGLGLGTLVMLVVILSIEHSDRRARRRYAQFSQGQGGALGNPDLATASING